MARVMGAQRHSARLRHMAGVVTPVTRALFVAGNEIEVEAERSITAGSASGKGHVASAPGSPPNADSRNLDLNIDTTIVRLGKVEVASSAKSESGYAYSVGLEFGNSRVEERSYMRPAAAKKRHRVAILLATAVSAHNQRG